MSKLALLAGLAVAAGASAQVWNEVGDAGELVGTAQVPAGVGALTAINGNMTASNADAYLIRIANPAAFSATTVGGTTLDTQLFLFSATGLGIATNDDSTGLQSTLPAGNALYAGLPAGNYIIAVSTFNYDPTSAGGLIFPNTFTGVNGPTGPGGGSPLSGWTGTSTAVGAYRITLTGAEFVPAPGAAALFGLAGLAGLRRRR